MSGNVRNACEIVGKAERRKVDIKGFGDETTRVLIRVCTLS